jgi:Zn-dependent protease with chaperone function
MRIVHFLKSITGKQWREIALALFVGAFAFYLVYLLVVNMALTLVIFGPILTIIVLWLLSMVLWLSFEAIADVLSPRVTPPQGGSTTETVERESPSLRHLKGGPHGHH